MNPAKKLRFGAPSGFRDTMASLLDEMSGDAMSRKVKNLALYEFAPANETFAKALIYATHGVNPDRIILDLAERSDEMSDSELRKFARLGMLHAADLLVREYEERRAGNSCRPPWRASARSRRSASSAPSCPIATDAGITHPTPQACRARRKKKALRDTTLSEGLTSSDSLFFAGYSPA